jgi:PiT family inorganic phosphate transporter
MAMEYILLISLLAAAFYVGWNIGANDAANCIGTTVGAAVLPFRSAALVMAVFVVLGGSLQGHRVMETVGRGIVITDQDTYVVTHGTPPPHTFEQYFPDGRLPDEAILIALLSAGLFVSLATFLRFPVSTSQAIVGGVAGVGIGIAGFDPTILVTSAITRIAASWVISPILAMLLAFALYWLLGTLLRRARAVAWSGLLRAGIILSAAYVSFSLGANDVGNAIGPLINKFPDRVSELALMGGVAIALGAMTFGRRVTDTVGHDITPLDYSAALAAQLSAGFGVHIFSMLGIPVSTSQAMVGAVVGVGLTKGTRAVGMKKVVSIVAGWVVTPLCAAAFSAAAYWQFVR